MNGVICPVCGVMVSGEERGDHECFNEHIHGLIVLEQELLQDYGLVNTQLSEKRELKL